MADLVTWQEQGHCWDSEPDWFHSDDLKLLALGIELCGECPVVKQCLREQERLNAPGIWGGIHWTTKGLERSRSRGWPHENLRDRSAMPEMQGAVEVGGE